jgi:3-phenylpropionate/trans-cinnamate dioxygenase ferredoxin reductase subunit
MADQRTFVIVGGGLAGAKAAETLRERGFAGRIALLGEEPVRPYERPPLSKDWLRGDEGEHGPWVHDEAWYGAHDVDLRMGARAVSVDAAGRSLELASGETIGWDALLLATGAAPVVPPIPGAGLAGVHVLRTIADAARLRDAIAAGTRLAIVGAGWIGSEVAASARQLGAEVALVEQAAVPLERVLGREVGEVYARLHAEHGVRLCTGVGVTRIEGTRAVEAVVLEDGERIPADLVLLAVGVRPRTELAEAAGLAVDDGVLVDEALRAGAPGVYAAGDVANAWHPLLGRRLRVEHWANAKNQGIAVAAAMLGDAVRYDRVPYFYSDQYDLGMEYSGHAVDWDEVVFRGDVERREFVAFWLRGGRVLAGMNANVWDVTEPIQALVRSGAVIDRARLVDPAVPLEALAAEAGAAGPEAAH